MKKWMAIAAALVLILGLAGSAHAKAGKGKDGTAKEEKNLKGKVLRVTAGDGEEMTIVVEAGGKKNQHDVSVAADGATVVTLDGVTAKTKDLKAGDRVTVSPAAGVAKKIKASRKGKAPVENDDAVK